VAHPFSFRKMNAPEVESIEQARVAVDHDPVMMSSGDLLQIAGQLAAALSRLSKVEDGRCPFEDLADHLWFIRIFVGGRNNDQTHG
jgi:hypothetical protein